MEAGDPQDLVGAVPQAGEDTEQVFRPARERVAFGPCPSRTRISKALFTAKEAETMRLYGEGLGYYRIGLLLGVSTATIRTRVLTARRKVAIARRGLA